jgi:hypothetical protein
MDGCRVATLQDELIDVAQSGGLHRGVRILDESAQLPWVGGQRDQELTKRIGLRA